MKIKKIKKNICHSFVQGRLSDEIGNKYKQFPIHNWRNELKIAKKFLATDDTAYMRGQSLIIYGGRTIW